MANAVTWVVYGGGCYYPCVRGGVGSGIVPVCVRGGDWSARSESSESRRPAGDRTRSRASENAACIRERHNVHLAAAAGVLAGIAKVLNLPVIIFLL